MWHQKNANHFSSLSNATVFDLFLDLGTTKDFTFLGEHVGSIFVVMLLNISKHGYLYVRYLILDGYRPNSFHTYQLRCLYYAGFTEVLVFSHAFQEQSFFLVFSFCFFDICEILYHAKALSDHRDPILSLLGYKHTPKTFDVVINRWSSYICNSECVGILVPIYFFFAVSIVKAFGQNKWLCALGLQSEDSSNLSFFWSMIGLITWQIFTWFLMRWVLLQNNICMTHDHIYLMKNDSEIMFVAPLILVGYFLITVLSFSQKDGIY